MSVGNTIYDIMDLGLVPHYSLLWYYCLLWSLGYELCECDSGMGKSEMEMEIFDVISEL